MHWKLQLHAGSYDKESNMRCFHSMEVLIIPDKDAKCNEAHQQQKKRLVF